MRLHLLAPNGMVLKTHLAGSVPRVGEHVWMDGVDFVVSHVAWLFDIDHIQGVAMVSLNEVAASPPPTGPRV
jgi:hypothetical protein